MQPFSHLLRRAAQLTTILCALFVATTAATAQGGGHKPVNLNAAVDLKLADKPAADVLDEITRRSGIRFAYDPQDIRRLPVVSGTFKQTPVKELLDRIVAGSTFRYTIENNVVLVYDSTERMRRFTVSGTVVDTGKSPLPGASVILKNGSGQGVSADEKGQFTFSFSSKTSPAVLEVGFLGMETRQIIVTGSMNGLKVTLEEGGNRIEDVVVNGMFSRNKNTYTGSVTTVKGEDLVAISNTNIMSALSAVTPGMVVVQNNTLGSNPNAIPEILIRGSNSIATSAEEKAYNNPLIILDGAEITMEELYDLDMYEIERIDVLKDAQAAIVYGDRAANGVIVIERQQVTDSKPRLSYNFVPELSIPDLSSMNLCNAAQKLELERLAGLYETKDGSMDKAYAYKLQNVRRGVNTDWISAPLRVPFSHSHSLSLSGRAQKIDYRASLRFSDKYGVMKGDNRRNYALNFSVGYHVRDKLTLRYTANFTLTDTKDSPYGDFRNYTRLNPYESPYDEYGELVKAFNFDPEDTSTSSEGYQVNPLYNATLSSFSKTRTQNLRNTMDAKWYITKDFYVSGQFNVDIGSDRSDRFVSPDDAQFLGETDPAKRGIYKLGSGKAFNYDGKIVLNYGRSIGSEGSGFMLNAGSDIQHTNLSSSQVTAMGFLKDNLTDIKYALGYGSSSDQLPTGSETLLAKVGFFVSGNVYFRNRYFADISYRTSGSSAYGSENRFAPMWSFGLGWNIHKEKFLEQVEWIDVMRLKWSWGYNGQTTGNPYQAITTYKYDNSYLYYTGVGAVPIRMGNPELKWQRVLKNNFGINLSLFKERLVVSFDYFRNTTKDQLMSIPLPASTGAEDITVNFGENRNFGYDFSVAGRIVQSKNWSWTTAINGSHVKDRIMRISDKLTNTSYQVDESSPLKLRFREGGSQYDIYAVRSGGIDPSSGQEIFIKKNGEITFKYDPADEIVVGNSQPALQGSWLNTLRYRGWSLNLVFSYTFGGDTYNKTLWEKVENIDPRYNVDRRAFTDRWNRPGQLSRYLALRQKAETYNSERFVERLNELWLSSATFTYEFQAKFLRRIGFKRLAVGVGVTDIFRLSSVKYERGTSYPYCRTINLMFRPTF